MDNEELDRFVRDMLATKDLPGLNNDEIRDQLVADLKQRLLDQIDRAVVDALPDDKADELNTLLDQPDITDEKMRDFVANSGVDVRSVTVDTMVRFRELYNATPEERES